MNEYRMTRPNVYPAGSPGAASVAGRQGHYIQAPNEAAAHRQMTKRFPKDSHFSCQLWKENINFRLCST